MKNIGRVCQMIHKHIILHEWGTGVEEEADEEFDKNTDGEE